MNKRSHGLWFDELTLQKHVMFAVAVSAKTASSQLSVCLFWVFYLYQPYWRREGVDFKWSCTFGGLLS